MRTKGLALVVVCLLAALWAVPAMAQEQTGSIEGVVKDASGAVLPGVTVEARSPQAVGVNTAVTNQQGVYRFPALPPGDYTITAKLEGFEAPKVQATIVLGKLLKIDIAMSVAGRTETVQVTGEAPLIDVKQNAAFATIDSNVISKIPKGRDFTSVVATAPGAQNESYNGGIQIDGASGSENRFVVDGMDTTNLRSGTSRNTVMTDFIQEVQVKSSGYNAEFGGATGGVISALTKSGGNSFRGGAGLYFNNDKMRAENVSLPRINTFDDVTVEQEKTPVDPNTYLNPIGELGGPVLKDKLWFYMGYAYTKNSTDRTVTFLDKNANSLKKSFNTTEQNHYWNWNVNTQVSSNLRVKVSGANQLQKSRGTLPSVLRDGTVLHNIAGHPELEGKLGNGYSQAAYDTRPEIFSAFYENTGTDYVNNLFSGNVDWVLTPTLFVNLTAGSLRYNTKTPQEFFPTTLQHYMSTATTSNVPADLQRGSGYVDTKSPSATVKALYGRLFLNANTIWYKNAGGQHTIKAGMRYERITQSSNDGYQVPRILFSWGGSTTDLNGNRVKGTYGYYRLRQIVTLGEAVSNNFGFWLQDSWSLNNKLTINAGVRTENEHVPTYTQSADAHGIDFGFRDKIAPRVGFAYDLQGNNRWKMYGSYGHFFDITKLSLPMGSFGADKWIDYYFTLDTYNWPSITCTDGMKGTGCTSGTLIKSRDMRYNSSANDPRLVQYGIFNTPRSTIDPTLKPYQSREFVLGMDHELNATMSVSMRYSHKWLVRAIEDVGRLLPFAELYFISNPGYGDTTTILPDFPTFHTPPATRKYDGLEISLHKRLADRWSAELSYTYSRLWGNYSGLAASDEEGRTDPNNNRSFDSLYQSFNEKGQWAFGPLKTDRPHVVKAQGTYDLPWGTTVGVFGIFQSGIPWSSYMDWQGYSPVFFADRGNMGRTPFYKRVDLSLQHDFRLGSRQRVQVNLNVDNVFNFKTVTDYWENVWRDAIDSFDDSVFFAGFDAYKLAAEQRAMADSGGYPRDNPLFGKPYGYQGRRSARLGLKWSF